MQWKGSEEQRSSFGIGTETVWIFFLRERQIEPHAVSDNKRVNRNKKNQFDVNSLSGFSAGWRFQRASTAM